MPRWSILVRRVSTAVVLMSLPAVDAAAQSGIAPQPGANPGAHHPAPAANSLPPQYNTAAQPGYGQLQPGGNAVPSATSVYQRPLAAPGQNVALPNGSTSYGQPVGSQPAMAQPGSGVVRANQPQRGIPGHGVRLVDAQEPIVTPPASTADNLAALITPQAGEHPLAPAIRWARSQVVRMNDIQDYSATLVKRERIDGRLNDHEYMFCKVRHNPYSVYIYFLGPDKVKGQECLYVEGKNDGKLMAHPNGLRHKLIGTVSLSPTSTFAMSGNRYPVTEMGIRRLATRLIEVGEQDMRFPDVEIKPIPGAKINGRDCTCLQVVHPNKRPEFLYHIARIYVDNELNIPIRFEAYEWPADPNSKPPLIEEYTYLNIKPNNGFTDLDFSADNPNYQFK